MAEKRKTRTKRRTSALTESGLVSIRVKILRGVLIAMFAVVVLQCFSLQVINSKKLQAEAITQWQSVTIDAASRGEITDCNGVVLASNTTSYMVLIHPQDIKSDDYDRISDELADLLVDYNRSREYIYARVSDTVTEKTDETKKTAEFVLVRRIDRDTADKIRKLNLEPGVVLAPDVTRLYPHANLLSQVLGYVSSDCEGISGIEAKYDELLKGRDGKTVADRTGTGARLAFGDEESIEKKNGNDCILTIDSNLQYFLENALEEAVAVNNAQNAQGIIMDVQTGAIKAISTKPDFNPNKKPTDTDELNALSRNRVVCDSYQPGSVFKIITLASALDSGTVSESYSISCGGASIINGERIKCWRSSGHGQQNLTQCAENSCNVAFMDLALRMGNDTFYDYIYKFGFGEVTSCGLPGEDAGIVTNKKNVRENDLARIGFGQSISVTPIQLITAVSAAVNGGKLMQPYIIDSFISEDGTVIQKNEPVVLRRVISEKTSEKVCRILESVVENGSGRNAKIAGYRIGGKTGTSQKAVDGKITSGHLIASFMGVAPIDNPKYACLILVDEPQVGTVFGSTVAAPFVKKVLEQTLEYAGYKRDTDAETVTVPNVTGKYTADAKAKLEAAGLYAFYQDGVDGKIVLQIPEAGTVVAKGSAVLLYTTDTKADSGNNTVRVPRLVGLTKYEAYEALEAVGLILEVDEDTEYTGGDVSSQYPYEGDLVEIGSVVKVKFK